MEEKKREDRDVIQFAGFGLLCATGSAVPPQCIHTNIHIYIYIYIIYMYDLSIFAIGTLHGPSCRFVNITQKIAVSLLGQRQHRK